jgi:putative transposase
LRDFLFICRIIVAMLRLILFILSFVTIWLRALLPNGARAIAAENIALRQQLISLTRNQKRSPRLMTLDKILFGILVSMINIKRLSRIAITLKPATLLKFHQALVKRKYHLLFTKKASKKPGPKGPEKALVDAIIEMKKRNPSYGYRRIAMQITDAFGILIDKDVVRRVLSKNFKDTPADHGPSWLTFIGHMKDSLWSVDLFRCESIHLQTHWVMLIMDQFTRRIIGFATHKGDVAGVDLCCMFNSVIAKKELPIYLSSDNDPLFQFNQWQANLRILCIEEIKSVPDVPVSHPFIERLIGTVRREFLDKIFFWNVNDLQNKLESFQRYYNYKRCHSSIGCISPWEKSEDKISKVISLNDYRWEKHCRGLYKLPIAA